MTTEITTEIARALSKDEMWNAIKNELSLILFIVFLLILLHGCIITLYLLRKQFLRPLKVPCKTKAKIKKLRFFGLEEKNQKIKHNYYGNL